MTASPNRMRRTRVDAYFPATFAPRTAKHSDIAAALFEQLPYGLIVTIIGGRVIAHNAAAKNQLGRKLRADTARCCDVLGCGAPGTPLEHACITELALREGLVLPEIRLNLPDRASAVWVTAAPLRDPGHVVIHVRPGVRGDRRRRAEPHWISGPQLRIRAFGSLRIDSEAGDLGGEWTHQRAGQLLAYLLCERRRSVRPDEIAEALWPDRTRAVLSTVRYFVHALRDYLEPERAKRQPSAFIAFRGGGYAFNHDAVQIDADEFDREAKAGLLASRRKDPHAEQRLTAALALNIGDFLADYPYVEWAHTERDRLHVLAIDALRALLEIRRARGEAGSTLAIQTRLADMDPLDESVHRELIAHHLRNNQPSEALRRYRALGERMHQELGRAPTFSISELSDAYNAPGNRA